VTRIRLFYPQNYDRNGPQAFPQSNMVVLVEQTPASPASAKAARPTPFATSRAV
jgi:hypothetical protein